MKLRTQLKVLERRADIFKALGHGDRLRIVEDLTDGEKCVCELVESVGSSWSTVSRHLSVLKEAGVVTDEKRGLQVFYKLALPCVPSFMDCLDASRKGEAVEMRRCCAKDSGRQPGRTP
ncbi:MAG: ArsR/SmtB family transcription factor [Opitutaceae bacterium]